MAESLVRLFKSKSLPGILLILAAVLAMAMENSPLRSLYDAIINTPVLLKIGYFEIDKPLLLWINDGLMAIFFLLVGLEIKREVLRGHLARPGQLALPLVAAFGGVAVPALIYAYFNMDSPDTLRGWAIPAATDIAFALGIITLLGNRIPSALKVSLMAIAIIDDLAAIIIIALFYTADTSLFSLGLASAGLAVALAMNLLGVKKLGPYALIGLFIWACVLKSGVHATLAGVALGLIIPLRTKNENGKSPLKVMEHALHPYVAFIVIPVFAFANAGLSFEGLTLDKFMHPITLGIIAGLFLGKQIGVMGLTWVACMLKICKLPDTVSWLQFYGLSLLTGIGFTMSLFIGTLAFSDLEAITYVRLGVLTASALSAVCGIAVLMYAGRNCNKQEIRDT